jgi:hypothetical protein
MSWGPRKLKRVLEREAPQRAWPARRRRYKFNVKGWRSEDRRYDGRVKGA